MYLVEKFVQQIDPLFAKRIIAGGASQTFLHAFPVFIRSASCMTLTVIPHMLDRPEGL
jgi:hypothetical protein